MHLLFNIFKEYKDLIEVLEGDSVPILLKTLGGTLIAVNFIAIGFFCLFYSRRNYKNNSHLPLAKKRLLISKLFGYFLISCGVSRGVEVYCFWHYVAILDGILTLITGVISFVALAFIPNIITNLIKLKSIEQVHKDIKETNKNIQTLTDLSKKLDNR